MTGTILVAGLRDRDLLPLLTAAGFEPVVLASVPGEAEGWARAGPELSAALVRVRSAGDRAGHEQVRVFARHTPTVAVVPDDAAELALALLEAGAVAVAVDSASDTELVRMLRLSAGGSSVLPTTVLRGLLAAHGREPAAPGGRDQAQRDFDDEDIALLRAIVQGVGTARLAMDSYVSERTIYRRLARLYRRLGARTRAQAIYNAVQLGLIDVDPVGGLAPEPSTLSAARSGCSRARSRPCRSGAAG